MLNSGYKELSGYENLYWVHPDGHIYNGRKKLKTYIINSGYACLKLHSHLGRKSFLVHRIIAENFLPNPDNKSEVNHIDGNKLNNNVCNLEWVSSVENKKHAKDNDLWSYNIPTLGISKGKSSKFHNVSYDKNRNKWIGSIRHNNQTLGQKRFNTEEEAALHVNDLLVKYNLKDRPFNVIP